MRTTELSEAHAMFNLDFRYKTYKRNVGLQSQIFSSLLWNLVMEIYTYIENPAYDAEC